VAKAPGSAMGEVARKQRKWAGRADGAKRHRCIALGAAPQPAFYGQVEGMSLADSFWI
jgi:hypothetical protein